MNNENTSDDYKLINMADVEAKEVEFLWDPYIPLGKMTIIQGDPGEGKTTAILQIAAALTKGERLPGDVCEKREPINVIYQTAEDGLADTIKPRLEAAGADCSKVFVIDESKRTLTMCDDRLEKAIVETGAKLLVMDPFQAYIGAKVDMNRSNETRDVFSKVVNLAEKYGCAVVFICHMNKTTSTKAIYKTLGSVDIVGAVRSVLLVSRIKDDPTCRVMAQVKSNLAFEGQPIAFRLDKETGFSWEGPIDIQVDELINGEGPSSKLEKAKKFLKGYLKDGPRSSKEIFEAAKEEGLKDRTLYAAKDILDISSDRINNKWYWGF